MFLEVEMYFMFLNCVYCVYLVFNFISFLMIFIIELNVRLYCGNVEFMVIKF